MLNATIYKSFKDLGQNSILTLYLDTKIEYVNEDGGAVVWPSDNDIYFLVNFPSILMSNIT